MIRFVSSLLTIGVFLSTLPLRANANLAPTVSLVSPVQGAHAVSPASICLAAAAADADGTVASVEFYEGTNSLGTDSLAPFVLKLTNVSAGTYNFTAVATDNLGASSTSSVVSVTILTNGAPIKIMPLGDSTTAGYTTPGGYRIELWSLLTNAGVTIDFVGTQTNGPPELPDLDHEGHDGFTINQLKAGITNWLNAAQPHIVLLQAGRNDIIQNLDLTNAPARLGSLIDAIHAHSPDIHVIVSTLTPVRQYDYYRNSIPFNEAIPALVSSRAALGRRVSLMDVNKALALFDLADGIHPKATGYQKEARFWFGALIPVLTCEAPPLIELTSPATNTTFLAPADLALTVGASDPDGTVARVEYYLDAIKVGDVTNAPFNFTLTNLGSGVFKLSARAIDDRGAATLTGPVTLSNNLSLVRGVNVNGPALVVDGLPWISWATATNTGLSITTADLYGFNQGIPYEYELNPTPDGDTDIIMWSAFYRSPALNGQGFTLSQTISNGYYQVYLWMIENGIAHFRDVDARLEGVTAATGLGDLPKGDWRKYGPYPVNVTDGVLDLDILRHTKGDPSLYGFAIFTINGTNTAPLISVVADQTTDEDTPLGPLAFTVGDAEIGASLLTISISASNTTLLPTNSFVLGGAGTNRTITIHPATNQFGTSAVTLTVSDGVNTTSTSFTLTVNAVNDTPSATSQSLTNLEDTPFGITLLTTDPETTNLNYTILAPPQHGTLSGTPPHLIYTPATNYFGADSFTFIADDGALTSAVATVSLTILAVNDAPLAHSQSLTNNEDQPLAITLTGEDVENSPLTFQIVSPPAHGALTGIPPNLTYTPATNYFGADSFTFVASDGALTSAVATVSLTILNLPDAPLVTSTNLSNTVNAPLALALPATDPDGDPLLYTITTTTTNGTLRVLDTNGAVLLVITNGTDLGTNNLVSYLPNTNYSGPDQFSFVTRDAQAQSAPAAYDITVNGLLVRGINLVGGAVTIEGQPWLGYTQALAAGLSVTNASTFNNNGPYGFPLSPVPDADTDTMLQSGLFAITTNGGGFTLTQTLTNGDYLVYFWTIENFQDNYRNLDLRLEGVTVATNLADLPKGHWRKYGPFTATVADGALDLDFLRHTKGEPVVCGLALYQLTSPPTNTPPTLSPIANQATDEDTPLGPLAFTIGDAETSANDLTLTAQSSNPALVPTNHIVFAGSGSNRTVTLTPATNASGNTTITLIVSDGALAATNSFLLTVNPVNDPPVADSQNLTNVQNAAFAVTLTGTDPEGSNLTFAVLTPPAHGLLTGAPPALTYRPPHGFTGTDSFTFVVDDGALTSAVATVALTVAPAADTDGDGIPDAWEIARSLNPLLNDADADADGDGRSNLEEYLANTDPLDPDSALHVLTVTRNLAGHNVLTWSGVGGVRYRVQFSDGGPGGQFNATFTDLVRPLALELDPAADGAASTQTFTDDFTLTGGAPPQGHRYYRIKVVP
jgi:lysophospholipase L1-like esterase